eukprot:3830311-Prymnesium_polylepis.1
MWATRRGQGHARSCTAALRVTRLGVNHEPSCKVRGRPAATSGALMKRDAGILYILAGQRCEWISLPAHVRSNSPATLSRTRLLLEETAKRCSRVWGTYADSIA